MTARINIEDCIHFRETNNQNSVLNTNAHREGMHTEIDTTNNINNENLREACPMLDYVEKAEQIRRIQPIPQEDISSDYIKADENNECEDCHTKGTDLLICCQCHKKICPNCVIESMDGKQYCQECDDMRPPDFLL